MDNTELEIEYKIKFSFIISDESKKVINQFIYTKIVQGHLKFNLTDAISEGVIILQKKNTDIPERKNLTRRFNKRGASKTSIKGKKNSILVNFLVYEWIENYTSFRIESDILYSRTLFIIDLVNAIKNKYKGKLLVVPEL